MCRQLQKISAAAHQLEPSQELEEEEASVKVDPDSSEGGKAHRGGKKQELEEGAQSLSGLRQAG